MIGWLIFAVWLTGFLLCWRTASWMVTRDLALGDPPDGSEIAGGLIIGAVVSIVWPLVVPVRILYTSGLLLRGADGIHSGFMRPPKAERERALRDQAERQQRRIMELERLNGIR